MFFPPRAGPTWLDSRDEMSQTRYAMVKPKDDTMWITNPAVDGATRDLDPRDRFTPVSRLSESFAAEAKALKGRRAQFRAERLKRNQERVLLAAYEEDQARQALEEKRLNGYRQQRIQYLTAVALRAD